MQAEPVEERKKGRKGRDRTGQLAVDSSNRPGLPPPYPLLPSFVRVYGGAPPRIPALIGTWHLPGQHGVPLRLPELKHRLRGSRYMASVLSLPRYPVRYEEPWETHPGLQGQLSHYQLLLFLKNI